MVQPYHDRGRFSPRAIFNVMKSEKSGRMTLLREVIQGIILSEKRGGKRTPGGPRTDIGALRQLEPSTFVTQVKSAVKDHDGDADQAARELGVAKRTLYHYLNDEPALGSVETSGELDDDDDDDRRQ